MLKKTGAEQMDLEMDLVSSLQDEDINIIAESELFDSAWYINEYKDVASAGLDPLVHYVKYGADEGRLPFIGFDPARYLAQLAEGERPGRNILAHYIANRGKAAAALRAVSEADAQALFMRRACSLRPLLARRPIEFHLQGEAEISVIVVLHNQLDLTLAALDSLRCNHPGGIDLLLADSGSTDRTRHIERHVRGARVIRFDHNAGFIEACNAAIPQAKAPVTLFMNNDILLERGAVAAVLRRFAAMPEAGAVGGKVIRTNGVLQEAGCIVWRDGTTEGYLRDGDPNQPEANFVREVDFCSGVFLAVRTRLLQGLGGFDARFKPAYFEDTDLCLSLAQAGHKIVYDPAIALTHLEHASSDAMTAAILMARNQPVFQQKHAEFLRSKYPRHPDLALHARAAESPGQRILFIEDRLPLRHLGSGYTRSNDIVAAMAALGHQVTVFPIEQVIDNVIDIYGDFPDRVELIHDRELPDLEKFIAQRSGFYDIVWIARTHNARRLAGLVADAQRHLPMRRIIVDTEAVAAPRIAGCEAVQRAKPHAKRRATKPGLAAAVERELAPARYCRRLIAVNAIDAALIRRAGFGHVAVLGHQRELCPTPLPFEERRNLLFVGAIHARESPNLDGLEWLATQLLPLLDAELPEDVRFSIAGYVGRGIDLGRLIRHPRIDLLGQVDDLAPLYDSHRLFIAPTRYAGGIPFKLHEAASFGLPIVASALLCRQVGWRDGVEILAADPARPAVFAAQIGRAYSDSGLWQRLRDAALARLAAENAPEAYRSRLRRILDGLDAEDGSPPPCRRVLKPNKIPDFNH